jgi:hypothetical protein
VAEPAVILSLGKRKDLPLGRRLSLSHAARLQS